ncbi:Response regulator receiver domain-containing protein [Pseudonocardia thermophila]|jgi:Response regulator containing a CheY-like receiver domain and an HTH DNA-binding domain|uniref:Response regulator receiver domain-containing protein n=1 Tax=Pseudonocardia thermophila TaxID=1848 RepID=A0A1M6P7A3_PSETH|nr:response regulator transcription factor [Pseudonocardia thermophila]SHK03824.1 Response regulator receiver domain-containing protein [Pseudonocardia thermophila]
MTGGTTVRLMVVDDQRPFRMAAARVAARTPGFELVGQAETGEDALAAAPDLQPDLVLMDVQLPGISGIEAASRMADVAPAAVVVLCSTYRRDDLPFPLDSPGVAAYLHKEELRPAALHELWERLRPRGCAGATSG